MGPLPESLVGDERKYPGNKLFNDRAFRLLRVHKTWRNRIFMTVVTPAFDPNCRKDVESQGYHCISHLWGDPAQCTLWTNSAPSSSSSSTTTATGAGAGSVIVIKDAANGKPVVARMRPEKRETLMQLLKSKGSGYWWIDVFCASKEMELGMMGDIYRHCKACYALLDVQPQTIGDYTTLTTFCNNYHEQCLLGNNHILPSLRQRFAFSLNNIVTQHQLQQQEDNDDPADNHDDVFLLRESMWRKFFEPPGFAFESDKIEGLCDMLGAAWWGRVWTLQETVMPPVVQLVAETDPECNAIPLDAVKALLVSMEHFMSIVDDQMDDIKSLLPADYNWTVFRRMQQSLKRITETLCLRTTYHQTSTDLLDQVLDHLSKSPRHCLDPCDYVYGVLGLLNMNIPRRNYPRDTWILFCKQLSIIKGKSFTEKMLDINLTRATCLEDVFKGMKS